jgi:hypothetical protein
MKLTKLLIAILISTNCYSQNPLSLWSPSWDNKVFDVCNTAKDANYMTQREKDVIWVLNCMRSHPSVFLQTVIAYWDYPSRYSSVREKEEYKSLIEFFKKIEPVDILYPDSLAFMSAKTRGEEYPSHRGHERTTKRGKDNKCDCGENISYNSFESVDIIMDFMVDVKNPNYGHRKDLVDLDYSKVGVAIRKENPGFFVSIIDLK